MEGGERPRRRRRSGRGRSQQRRRRPRPDADMQAAEDTFSEPLPSDASDDSDPTGGFFLGGEELLEGVAPAPPQREDAPDRARTGRPTPPPKRRSGGETFRRVVVA